MKNKILLLMVLGLSIHTTSAITEWFNPMKYRIVKAACKRFRVWCFPAYYQKKDIEKYYVFLQNLQNETSNDATIRRHLNLREDFSNKDLKLDKEAENQAKKNGCIVVSQKWKENLKLKTPLFEERAQGLQHAIMNHIMLKDGFGRHESIDPIINEGVSKELAKLSSEIGFEKDLKKTHKSIRDEWPDLFALASFYHRKSFANKIRNKKHLPLVEEAAKKWGISLDREDKDRERAIQHLNDSYHQEFQEWQKQQQRVPRVLLERTPLVDVLNQMKEYSNGFYLGRIPKELRESLIPFVDYNNQQLQKK